jgi:hypothetical protein
VKTKKNMGEYIPLFRKRNGSFKIDELPGEEAVRRTLQPRRESKVVPKRSTVTPDKLN